MLLELPTGNGSKIVQKLYYLPFRVHIWRRNISRVLGVFIEDLQEFQLALDRGDVKAVEEFFANAKQRRDQWRASAASASPE